jgi:hypothetical protein
LISPEDTNESSGLFFKQSMKDIFESTLPVLKLNPIPIETHSSKITCIIASLCLGLIVSSDYKGFI